MGKSSKARCMLPDNRQTYVTHRWVPLIFAKVTRMVRSEDLICIIHLIFSGTSLTYNQAFLEQTGLAYVRGCEVEGMLDKNGRVIEEGPEPKPEMDGDTRTYRVLLDQNQYKIDMDGVNEGKEVSDPIEHTELVLFIDFKYEF